MLIGGAPHGLHFHRLARHITLVLAIGVSGNSAQNVALALHALAAITPPLVQRDLDALKQTFSPLDTAMRKVCFLMQINDLDGSYFVIFLFFRRLMV